MAEELKPIKIWGKECTVSRSSKGVETIRMSNSDFAEKLNELGVTKEVRDVVQKATDKLAEDSAIVVKDRIIEINKGKKPGDEGFIPRVEFQLGSGKDSFETVIDALKIRDGKGIGGKPYHTETYGSVTFTKNAGFAREARKEGGVLDQIQKQCMAAFAKKK